MKLSVIVKIANCDVDEFSFFSYDTTQAGIC